MILHHNYKWWLIQRERFTVLTNQCHICDKNPDKFGSESRKSKQTDCPRRTVFGFHHWILPWGSREQTDPLPNISKLIICALLSLFILCWVSLFFGLQINCKGSVLLGIHTIGRPWERHENFQLWPKCINQIGKIARWVFSTCKIAINEGDGIQAEAASQRELIFYSSNVISDIRSKIHLAKEERKKKATEPLEAIISSELGQWPT